MDWFWQLKHHQTNSNTNRESAVMLARRTMSSKSDWRSNWKICFSLALTEHGDPRSAHIQFCGCNGILILVLDTSLPHSEQHRESRLPSHRWETCREKTCMSTLERKVASGAEDTQGKSLNRFGEADHPCSEDFFNPRVLHHSFTRTRTGWSQAMPTDQCRDTLAPWLATLHGVSHPVASEGMTSSPSSSVTEAAVSV